MRTFYLFEVKDNILKNYKYNYEELYSMLESIYNIKNEDIVNSYSIFKSIVNPIKKDKYNEYIKKNNIGSENYICYNYTHSINYYYLDECTKMIINNSHIIIKTDKNVSKFFKYLNGIDNHFFVCDFGSNDYFYLNEFIILNLNRY